MVVVVHAKHVQVRVAVDLGVAEVSFYCAANIKGEKSEKSINTLVRTVRTVFRDSKLGKRESS